MTQGPACSTVTGRTSPFESNSCVMPTFLPRMPVTRVAISISIQLGFRYWLAGFSPFMSSLRDLVPNLLRLLMFFPERLDLHIHSSRQIELHQRVHRLLRRLENIEQTLVGADFKLLPRLLIHVRRTQHAVLVLHRGQWNRARDLRPRTLGRVDDLSR